MSTGGELGSMVGGAVGGIAGVFGGNPMLGFSIGSTVGGLAGNAISPTKGPHSTVRGPQLGDLSIQSSSYGVPWPIIFGTFGQMAGNVIWSTQKIETEHTTTQSSGGKGGPPKQTQTTTNFTYSISFSVGLCAGPIGGVKRIWAFGKLVWDATNPIPNSPISGMTLYYGTEDQMPDPTMEAHLGVGNVPAYRGLAHIVFTNLDLGPWQGQVPNLTFEIIGQGTPTITTAFTHTDSDNGNPAAVAVDTETGLIWMTVNKTATDWRMIVLRPDTWEVVKTVDLPSYGPADVVYQPGYTYQYVDEDTGLVVNAPIPPRMWVGVSDGTEIIWAIDTRTYQIMEVQCYLSTPSGSSTRHLAIDLSGLDYNRITTTPAKILSSGLGLGGYDGSVMFLIDTVEAAPGVPTTGDLDLGAGETTHFTNGVTRIWPDALNPSSFSSAGGCGMTQGVSGTTGIYILDAASRVFKMTSAGDVVAGYLFTEDVAGGCGVAHTGRITYDPDEDMVYVISTPASDSLKWHLYKFDADLTLQWERSDFYPDVLVDVKHQRSSGTVWLTRVKNSNSAMYFHAIDPVDGTDLRAPIIDATSSPGNRSMHSFAVPYPNSDFMMLNTNYTEYRKVPLVPVALSTTTLGEIVSTLSLMGALEAGDIDVTGLGSLLIDGYAVTTRTTIRGAIEPLCRVFPFDGVESDGKVKFVLRGGASVVTIPSTDVAARTEDSEPEDPLMQARAQEADLPNEIEVSYPDPSIDYRPVLQYARRLTGESKEKMAVTIPVVVTAANALVMANMLLYVAWTERDSYTFSITRKYVYLDPADLVTYQAADGTLTVMRITKMDYSFPLLLKIEAVKEEPSIYAGFLYAAGVGGYESTTVTAAIPTQLHLLDIPLIRDTDSNPGFYVAGSGYYEGWTSGLLYRSTDTGGTYDHAVTLSSEATVGSAATALGSTAAWTVWDDVNTVVITIEGGVLDNATDLEVYNGANAAMLGSELIQWGVAVNNGNGTTTLSHLLRARRGTDWALSTHAVGEVFIVLTTGSAIQRLNYGLADIGLTRLYKAASPGQYLTDLTPRVFANTAVGLKPYSPINVAGTRDGSNNLTLTWTRRTRVGGEWRDYVDVPLSEFEESYSIDVMDGADVVRTLTSTTPTVAYSAANQTTDGFTPGDPIAVNVYQMSEDVGRGYAAAATV